MENTKACFYGRILLPERTYKIVTGLVFMTPNNLLKCKMYRLKILLILKYTIILRKLLRNLGD